MTNLPLKSLKISKKFDDCEIDSQLLLVNLNDLLVDFDEKFGCSCAFIDFKNKLLASDYKASLIDVIKNEKVGFERLFQAYRFDKSEEKNYCDYTLGNNQLIICFPVVVNELLYGFVIYESFTEQPELYQVGVKTTYNNKLNSGLRLAKILSNQANTAYELHLQKLLGSKTHSNLQWQRVFFESIFENSSDAVAILDNEDRLIKINKGFEELFGYSGNEAVSKFINDLIVPDSFKEEGQHYTKQAALGQKLEFTSIRKNKQGEHLHVQVTSRPIYLDDKKIAICAIYRNITEQVWQRKQEKIVYGISSLLNSNLKTADLVPQIANLLKPVFGNGEMFLELVSPTKRSLRSFSLEYPEYKNVSFANSLSFEVFRQKKKLHLNREQINEIVKLNNLILSHKTESWIGFPLIDHDVVIGVFGVSWMSNEECLDIDSTNLLELISVQLSSGISRMRREQELKKINRSMHQSPASIIITNRDGEIEYVNPKFCEITGYTSNEVLGRNPRFLKSGFTTKETYDEMWQQLRNGGEWFGELVNIKKNNELFWERANMSAVTDEFGKIVNYVAIKEDITEYKEFEKELIEAKHRAEESDRLKSAFLANMSHELRTPLNAVIGFSSLCNDSMDICEILEFMQLINKSGNQLLEIIEDILMFTLLESQKIKITQEEFFVGKLLEEVKEQAYAKRELENKQRVELKFVFDPSFNNIILKTDYQHLMLVVVNLLKNAFKFTDNGYVEFGCVQKDDKIQLYVKDTGIGIENNKKEIIFERFRQVDNSLTRIYGGIGMGLTISKNIMDALGGKIEVESEPNVGSVFTISLDCVNSNKCENTINDIHSKKETTILVAEDELMNYRLIEAILKRNNYKVIRAENGLEAIQICKEIDSIDLVLMDIRMPELDGMKATAEIKKIKPDLKIIAQTAYAMNGDKDKALEVGCDDYITKPIKKEILLKKIKSFVE